MKKKQIVDLITSVFLIICGSVMLLFPLFHFVKVKGIFLGVLGVYAILNLIKFLGYLLPSLSVLYPPTSSLPPFPPLTTAEFDF